MTGGFQRYRCRNMWVKVKYICSGMRRRQVLPCDYQRFCVIISPDDLKQNLSQSWKKVSAEFTTQIMSRFISELMWSWSASVLTDICSTVHCVLLMQNWCYVKLSLKILGIKLCGQNRVLLINFLWFYHQKLVLFAFKKLICLLFIYGAISLVFK